MGLQNACICGILPGVKTKLQIPVIPEEEQTPVVKGLLVLLEQFTERLQEQDEEIARLKDEISILKGEKKRPTFKPLNPVSWIRKLILTSQGTTRAVLKAVVSPRNGQVRARRPRMASSPSMRLNA